MTEPEHEQHEQQEPAAQVDPKEAMRQALEAKKSAQHAHDQGAGQAKSIGATHAQAAGKRQFRRKSGG